MCYKKKWKGKISMAPVKQRSIVRDKNRQVEAYLRAEASIKALSCFSSPGSSPVLGMENVLDVLIPASAGG